MRLSPFWPLALFFAFSSLAFGCMEGWAIAACEGLLFLGAAAVGWRRPGFWSFPRHLWVPAAVALAFAAIGLLQLVPAPSAWWKATGSPRQARFVEGAEGERFLHEESYRRDPFAARSDQPLPAEVWTPQTPAPTPWISASFTPGATGRAVLALLAVFGLILLLEEASRQRGSLSALAWVVGMLGIAVALAALVGPEAFGGKILGIRESARAGIAFGPFVNRNHGGAFLNLAMPFLYALLWRDSRRGRRRANRVGRLFLVAALVSLHLGALVVGGSRGAWIGGALLPLGLLLHWALRGSRVGAWAAAAWASALVGALALGLWAGYLYDPGRATWWRDVPGTAWPLGAGLNSFSERFPATVETQPLWTFTVPTHLENEYLQAFFEGGALAAALLAVGAVWVLWACWKGLGNTRAYFWLVPALFAETLHAAVDFTGHVFPIVGVYLLALVCLRSHGETPPPGDARPAPAGTPGRPFPSLAAAALALAAVGAAAMGRPQTAGGDFRQGAYGVLTEAERLVAAGRGAEAAERYAVAIQRANRAGRPQVAERVRLRCGSAGKELARTDLAAGWPLLARYALWSEEFGTDARRVEAWALNLPGAGPRFEYPLLDRRGRSTWGQEGAVVPLGLLRDHPRLFPADNDARRGPAKRLYYSSAEELPKEGRWAFVFPTSLSNPASGVAAWLEVEEAGTRSRWFASVNHRIRWSQPLETASTGALTLALPQEEFHGLDRLVAVGGRRPPEASARLVHTYTPLE